MAVSLISGCAGIGLKKPSACGTAKGSASAIGSSLGAQYGGLGAVVGAVAGGTLSDSLECQDETTTPQPSAKTREQLLEEQNALLRKQLEQQSSAVEPAPAPKKAKVKKKKAK